MLRKLLLVVLLASLALPATANGTPLHTGSKGKRVCAMQWLLSGHRPSVYRGVNTYRLGKPMPTGAGCQYGKRMVAATREAKRQLGFRLYWNGTAGQDFRDILTGKKARPLGYIVRAARVKAEDARKRDAARLTYAARVISLARRELGVTEVPWGSNRGARVATYQSYTGAYGAPWCASFTQAIYSWAGVGTFANRSAGVFYIVGYARSHGWLRSYPRPGWLVGFLDRLGHIGIVERTTTSGIYSIEGNASNSVLRRFHPLSNERPKVYIAIPGIDRRIP